MRKKLGIPIGYTSPSRITGFTKIKLGSTDSLFDESHRWSLVSKPKNSLAMLNKVKQPTLIADVIGDYVIELRTGDDDEKNSPTTVTITVTNEMTFHPSAKSTSIH